MTEQDTTAARTRMPTRWIQMSTATKSASAYSAGDRAQIYLTHESVPSDQDGRVTVTLFERDQLSFAVVYPDVETLGPKLANGKLPQFAELDGAVVELRQKASRVYRFSA